MEKNQYETHRFGCHWLLASQCPRRRSAFTLTELLVVIAIIAVLAALGTAAALNAFRAGKRTRIVLEMQQLSSALEDFKGKHGAYPPNGTNPSGAVRANGNYLYDSVKSDFVRMFKKAFPRHREPQALIEGFGGRWELR